MSLSWPAVNGTQINMTVATIGAIGTGDYTVIALVQPNGLTVGAYWGAQVSSSFNLDCILDAGTLFGGGDFSGLPSTMNGTDWQLVGQSKASGSNVYRWHYWNYTTNSAKTHTNGSGTHANPGTITAFNIGQGDNRGNGLIAVVGVWKRVLSDAEIDSLCTSSLADWASLAPDALWPLNVAAASVVDVTGNGNNAASVSGTISAGADPPGFSYSLAAAAPPTAAAQKLPPHLLSLLAARNQAMWLGAGQATATINGTAALSGAGVLAATVNQLSTATPTGAGSLAAAVTQRAAATPTGAGALTGSVTQLAPGTPTGAGALTATGTASGGATAALTGAGSLTATVVQRATVTAAGAGSLTAAAVQNGSTVITGGGALTAPGVQLATASPTGAGALTGIVALRASALLVGAGAVDASTAGLKSGVASLVGAGALTAVGDPRHTPRPFTGITAHAVTITARPFTGITEEPD